MEKVMDIAYEPHPVSPERKAELRAQGKRIIDIRFKPADMHKASEDDAAGGNGEPASIPSKSDIANMKRKDCIEWLDAHGADTSGNVADLRERLRAVMFMDAE